MEKVAPKTHQMHHSKNINMGRLKVKEWKKKYHVKINKRKTEVAITSDKVDFRTKEITRDRE